MTKAKVEHAPVRSRVVPGIDGFEIAFYEKPYHSYKINGEKVPSVTQILGTLDKSRPLVAWATRIDVAGALRIATGKWVRCVAKGCDDWLRPIPAETAMSRCGGCGNRVRPYRLPDEGWKFQRDIKLAGFDHDTVVADAQIRGTTVHSLHEDWVKERKLPVLGDYPVAWRGYIKAYARWLMANRDVDFESAEVLTGSPVHGFAGTCDTVAVTRTTGGKRKRYDFKTSKAVYPSTHFPQLAAYELGAVCCGDEPTDEQAIVRLGADGDYEVVDSDAGPEDFLTVLAVWQSQKRWKDRERKEYNARRKARRVSA